MRRRIAILVLLTTLVSSVAAQNDSILVSGRDTIAYTYTPITLPSQPLKPKRENKAWNRLVQYFVESAKDNSFERRVDFSFIPAIYYSNSTSAGLAFIAAGLYRIDKNNREIPASDFSIYATASLTGFYRVGIEGNNIFRNDRRRITYTTEFYSQPTRFWGLG
jgi:hypothetical protein